MITEIAFIQAPVTVFEPDTPMPVTLRGKLPGGALPWYVTYRGDFGPSLLYAIAFETEQKARAYHAFASKVTSDPATHHGYLNSGFHAAWAKHWAEIGG